MHPINMQFLLYLFIFILTFSYTTTSDLLNKFNITIQIPQNVSSPAQLEYKSVHVKYTMPSNNNQWNIVAIKPFIQISNETIKKISVHICQETNRMYQQNSIWYDDETICNNAQSMLIYQWRSYSSLTPFQISDDLGFQLDKSKSIVLSVVYTNIEKVHKDQAGVIIHISTQIPRYYIGTIVVGNQRQGTRFSCRSSNYPRLIYAITPLFSKKIDAWWHIYVIRKRSFGRKLVQFVLNSTIYLTKNKTDIEFISSEIFLLSGDYLIIECEQILKENCEFLIFYTYKNIQYKYSYENDYICESNNYPDLFKLISSKPIIKTNKISSFLSNIDGLTKFLLVCVILFIIWISIIIGCIIMRRIRGLVNFRTEPPCQYSCQNGKINYIQERNIDQQNQQKLIAASERIAQYDMENIDLTH